MKKRERKVVAKHDADYAVNPGNSNETSIKISQEICDFFLNGETLTDGTKKQVEFSVRKEDFVRAASAIISRLPLLNKGGGRVYYSDERYKELFAKIESFFGGNESMPYKAELLYNTSRNSCLQSLAQTPSDFNIRQYLIEKFSCLEFEFDTTTNQISLRIKEADSSDQPKSAPPNISEYVEMLNTHKQLVLTGAPGTGKTFLAKEIAKAITGETISNATPHPHVEFCQFHPSMDYTDFVEGLRPTKESKGDSIGFERKDGLFMEFCRRAVAKGDSSNKYVFIIDEINRGDIAKIFGELFYSIEAEYRGPEGAIKTQFNTLHDSSSEFSNGFYIPSNVYIIGTMNDIDRGVESMDFAIRRRFAWHEVMPEDRFDEMLTEFAGEDWFGKAKNVSIAVNNTISDAEFGLGKAFCIGPAYFRKLKNFGGDFNLLWSMSLEPLIKEYLRGGADVDEKIKALKKVYFNAEIMPAATQTPADEGSVSSEAESPNSSDGAPVEN